MGLFGWRMACGAFYTATETVAPPGRRCFRHYQLAQVHNHQLSTILLSSRITYLPEGRTLRVHFLHGGARRPRSQDAPALGTINYQFTTTNYQLSTFNFQLFICHALPCFIAIARFGGGNDLFASMMAFGAFYTATETVALPGHRATVSRRGGRLWVSLKSWMPMVAGRCYHC